MDLKVPHAEGGEPLKISAEIIEIFDVNAIVGSGSHSVVIELNMPHCKMIIVIKVRTPVAHSSIYSVLCNGVYSISVEFEVAEVCGGEVVQIITIFQPGFESNPMTAPTCMNFIIIYDDIPQLGIGVIIHFVSVLIELVEVQPVVVR